MPEPLLPPVQLRRPNGWAIAAALLVLVVLIYLLRLVLLPFVVAGALALVAAPVMRFFIDRLGMPRWLAAVATFTCYLAILGVLAYWINAVLIPQAYDLGQHLPDQLHQTFVQLFRGEQVRIMGKVIAARALADAAVQNLTAWLGNYSEILVLIAASLEAFIAFFLTLVLLFYFLLSGPRLLQGLIWLAPPHVRPQVHLLVQKMIPVLYLYLRGMILVVIYATGVTWLALHLVLHLPHAILLAIMTGILELIPVIGPVASATLLSVVAVEHGSAWVIIGFALFALFLRLSIDQLVGPLVLGRALTLHPVVIIFAFLAGGTLFGIFGVFVAVPVAATIKIALLTLYGEEGPWVPGGDGEGGGSAAGSGDPELGTPLPQKGT